MKLSHVTAFASVSGVYANIRQDTLVAQVLPKLGQHIGINGCPEPKTCTIEEARVRRECSLQRKDPSGHVRWNHTADGIKFGLRTSANTARVKVNFVTSRKA
jgi:hypothetical protein